MRHKIIIDRTSPVNEIVRLDHHTVDVFRKYGIEYCCGGKWPLEGVCVANGLDFDQVKKELELSTKGDFLPPSLHIEGWDLDFLIDYIINIHHGYLKATVNDTAAIIKHFTEGHLKKYPFMEEVLQIFENMQKTIFPHIRYEEETIFPYIRQICHAYANRDSYASLLVKTLRKPLGVSIRSEEDIFSDQILKIRMLTADYSIPGQACTSHRVVMLRLEELDKDLMQHIYLETEILFPRALKIEAELLQ